MFGTKPFNRPAVQPQSLGKPTARFPGAIAGDSDLMIAVDRQVTNLAATLDASSTSMSIRDPAMVGASQLLSIDAEIVRTLAAPVGNTVSVQRGFDGTTPAVHLAGAAVSGLIDAWHHNALVSEVEAIETALGPNLSNLPTAATITNCSYIFTPQTPGGNLIVGTNAITLTPVPKGIYGTSTGHSLYISGGTGTAEAVPITGGSAVGGAASGTVIVTCASAHSGAWTIQSATAGIQEAVAALPAAGGEVIVSCNGTMYANVVSLGRKVWIKKLAAQSLTNMGNPYSILGSITYDQAADCVYTTDAITMGPCSSDVATFYPTDPGVKIVRAIKGDNPAFTTSYSCSGLFVQEDYNGAAGTPFAIRVQLNCSKNTSSAGVAAVAAYTEMGAASGTEAIGLHGDASTHTPNSVCVSVNAEGTYFGTAPGATMYGYVCNIGTNNTGPATMKGAHIAMQPNYGGSQNAGGGVDISAEVSGSHAYGLYIGENGGTFQQTSVFSSTQTDSNNVVLNNNSAASVATTNIVFRRTTDPLSAPTTSVTARIVSSHSATNYGAGSLKLCTGNGAGAVPAGLTVDYTQLVTVANCVKTTPITVNALPPAASSVGCWACVTDSPANTVGTPVPSGGGSYTVGVFCSTRGWIIVAN